MALLKQITFLEGCREDIFSGKKTITMVPGENDYESVLDVSFSLSGPWTSPKILVMYQYSDELMNLDFADLLEYGFQSLPDAMDGLKEQYPQEHNGPYSIWTIVRFEIYDPNKKHQFTN